MKLDCELLAIDLSNYRRSFLKRKNINRYVKQSKGTPIILDKLMNAFDRKIKGIPIFTEDVKKEYFEGLKKIYSNYYEEIRLPKPSRKDAYISYLAENYCLYGKKYKTIQFDEFVKRGLSNNYR
jgi:hypothetical protein